MARQAKPEPCPFCQYAQRPEAADRHIAFDGLRKAMAFQPLAPATPGHTLVCPTRHVRRITDLPAVESGLLWGHVRATYGLLLATGHEAMNVVVQDGEAAGMSVPHLHVHLVPRTEGDGLGFRWEP
jgi:histidine triad (HIT) family protein